jgi:hypothetical protein
MELVVRAWVLRPRRVHQRLAKPPPAVLPSAHKDSVGTPNFIGISRLNSPARTPPVNASLRPRGTPTHDSGPPQIATPSMWSVLISFSMPVYPGAFLDAPNLPRQPREQGGLIAETGAHLQNALLATQAERFEHHGDQRGLARELPTADPDRAVTPGLTRPLPGHVCRPRRPQPPRARADPARRRGRRPRRGGTSEQDPLTAYVPPQPPAQAGSPRRRPGDRSANGLLGPSQDQARPCAGDGRVEQLPRQHRRRARRKHDRGGIELRALALVTVIAQRPECGKTRTSALP